MFLEDNTFKTVISSAPLVSIDLLVKNAKGEYLLGYRTNPPAKNFWFTPGGRIRKDESLDSAFLRLTEVELGVKIERKSARFISPFEHLHKDSIFGTNISTHYIVLAYEISLNLIIEDLPPQQHSKYKWFEHNEFIESESVHEYAKSYIQ
jgi:colanic acid biosynthesis protein WcaH